MDYNNIPRLARDKQATTVRYKIVNILDKFMKLSSKDIEKY
jgi:hypothetical protein